MTNCKIHCEVTGAWPAGQPVVFEGPVVLRKCISLSTTLVLSNSATEFFSLGVVNDTVQDLDSSRGIICGLTAVGELEKDSVDFSPSAKPAWVNLRIIP